MERHKESPPPLPRYDVLVRTAIESRARRTAIRKAYNCKLAPGSGEYDGYDALTYLHRIYDKCPSFKAVEGEYGFKLYILGRARKPSRRVEKKRHRAADH